MARTFVALALASLLAANFLQAQPLPLPTPKGGWQLLAENSEFAPSCVFWTPQGAQPEYFCALIIARGVWERPDGTKAAWLRGLRINAATGAISGANQAYLNLPPTTVSCFMAPDRHTPECVFHVDNDSLLRRFWWNTTAGWISKSASGPDNYDSAGVSQAWNVVSAGTSLAGNLSCVRKSSAPNADVWCLNFETKRSNGAPMNPVVEGWTRSGDDWRIYANASPALSSPVYARPSLTCIWSAEIECYARTTGSRGIRLMRITAVPGSNGGNPTLQWSSSWTDITPSAPTRQLGSRTIPTGPAPLPATPLSCVPPFAMSTPQTVRCYFGVTAVTARYPSGLGFVTSPSPLAGSLATADQLVPYVGPQFAVSVAPSCVSWNASLSSCFYVNKGSDAISGNFNANLYRSTFSASPTRVDDLGVPASSYRLPTPGALWQPPTRQRAPGWVFMPNAVTGVNCFPGDAPRTLCIINANQANISSSFDLDVPAQSGPPDPARVDQRAAYERARRRALYAIVTADSLAQTPPSESLFSIILP